MADVTVNIRGDASQLRGELDDVAQRGASQTVPVDTPSNGGGGGGGMVTNDRMIEDVRREMRQRGVLLVPGSSSMAQIINQYGQSQRDETNEEITQRYNSKRADLGKRRSSAYDDVDAAIEIQRKKELANIGAAANDPMHRALIDQKIEYERNREYKKVGQKFDIEENALNASEGGERKQADIELTAAIKELTDYFNRQAKRGDNPDSYLGKLREQQRALVHERDNAYTEEDAADANNRLNEINEKMKLVLSGPQQGRSQYDSMLQGSQGLTGMLTSMQSSDIGGMIMGAGGAYAGLSGMGLKTALKFLGWVGVAATIASGTKRLLEGGGETIDSMAGVASLRSTTGFSGRGSRDFLRNQLGEGGLKYNEGMDYSHFDMSPNDFLEEAFTRTKNRGETEDWLKETYRQIGLEKNFGLNQGALREGGTYDRYGTNVTEALSDLVTVLNGIEGSGVSYKNFERVQEKFDIQQRLMSSYMGRTDLPSYEVANRTLAAFSSVPGIPQDPRLGGDIQAFQEGIANPTNSRFKTLIYGAVSDLYPEMSGRPDLIDRAIKDPSKEMAIIETVVKRIQAIYGGTDTTTGYGAMKAFLKDAVPPEKMDKYAKAFGEDGITSKIIRGEINTNPEAGKLNMEAWTRQSVDLLSGITKDLKDISNMFKEWSVPWGAGNYSLNNGVNKGGRE